MDVTLSAEQRAFAQQAVLSGRLASEEDAIREALQLWVQRERARTDVLAAVNRAEDSLRNGLGRPVSEGSMRELAAKIKQRGRDRLAELRQENDAA
ncbi:MAG: hypothetical protein P4L03_00070 [Terracidiphilus sp.]|nr:hypothetical protein [Terracidiphilus sp.]